MLGLLFWWRSKDPRAPPFRDILIDIRNRLPHYKDDWAQIKEWKLWCVTPSMALYWAHACLLVRVRTHIHTHTPPPPPHRILAPATYVFFTSILPAISFGEQLAQNTEGELTVVHVVVSAAIGGLVQVCSLTACSLHNNCMRESFASVPCTLGICRPS